MAKKLSVGMNEDDRPAPEFQGRASRDYPSDFKGMAARDYPSDPAPKAKASVRLYNSDSQPPDLGGAKSIGTSKDSMGKAKGGKVRTVLAPPASRTKYMKKGKR